MNEEAERILDAALSLAARRGWEALHLHELGREMGIGLWQIQQHYPHKDAIAEALFDRADRALVQCAERPGWLGMPVHERLGEAMRAWLQVLAPHRPLVRQMLRYKLQPDHVHLQLQGLLHISRTVQWWREAAALPSVGLRRELEEAALTTLYLATVARWLTERPAHAGRALAWLDARLATAARLARRLPG